MKDGENKSTEFYYDDEIDLYEVFLLLRKRKKVIFLSLAFFLVIGVVYLLIARPVYRVEHHFTEPISANLPAQIQKGVIALNSYLEAKDYEKVAQLLSLPVKDVELLSQVSFLRDKEEKDIFSISIDAYSPELLLKLDKAVVKYLEELPSVSEAVSIRRKSLSKKLAFYQSRLKEIVDFASGIKKELLSGNLEVVGFNPLSVETTIVDYQAKIVSLKLALERLAPFKDIVVATSDEPVKPKKLLVIAISLISGLFVGIFLAFFLEWFERAEKREKAS